VLDIGVGAGHTVELMRRFGPGYQAIDYSAEMVRACQQRYPDVDVREGTRGRSPTSPMSRST
jgi:trans-aconitate methyltransferase